MKNKKSIIAIVLVCVLGIIGTTIAYFSSSNTFQNLFRTTNYSMSVSEIFNSPQDWTPGTTTTKRVIANNSGLVDAAVRISYTEEWTDSEGNPLSLADNQTPPRRFAIINHGSNFANEWIESTEGETTYYYYKAKIAPGETSSSFIESVTFNPNAAFVPNEDCSSSTSDQSVCNIGPDGHAGGQYKLTITVETAQYDKYREIWGTNVDILESAADIPTICDMSSGDCDTSTMCNVVYIGNEPFYVLKEYDDKYLLFAMYNLNIGNNIQDEKYGLVGRQNSKAIGYNDDNSTAVNAKYPATIAFSDRRYWSGYGDVYNQNTTIKPYVDKYVTYLKSIDSNVISGRIPSYELWYSDLGFDGFYSSEGDWTKQSNFCLMNTSYWVSTPIAYDNLYFVYQGGMFGDCEYCQGWYYTDNTWGVRPIIYYQK